MEMLYITTLLQVQAFTIICNAMLILLYARSSFPTPLHYQNFSWFSLPSAVDASFIHTFLFFNYITLLMSLSVCGFHSSFFICLPRFYPHCGCGIQLNLRYSYRRYNKTCFLPIPCMSPKPFYTKYHPRKDLAHQVPHISSPSIPQDLRNRWRWS